MRNLKVSLEEKLLILRHNVYFDHLSEADLHHVAHCTQLREYERGEVLFLEEGPCTGLYILQHGCVKLYRLSPQGRQYIVRLLRDGDTFNEVSVFDYGGNPVNAEALETTQVWVVQPECIRDLVRRNPEFAQKVIYNLGQNLRRLVQAVSEMAFYQVTNRLARLISDLDEAETVPLTQEQIAARLGTVREVVARSLRELERAGAIRMEKRRIYIVDRALLRQWAQGECA